MIFTTLYHRVFLGRAGRRIVHVALQIAYDASKFQAYARDGDRHTVESGLLKALRREGFVEGSFKTGSRTDAGVSAVQNVISFQMMGDLRGIVPRLQLHLPPGLWATAATEVPSDFMPRYHAIRTYNYYAPKSAEDPVLMQAACELFEGEHNMSGFARVEPPRNPVRIIEDCSVTDAGQFWCFTISSPGFLWNQVRRMIDAILKVGQGRIPLEAIPETLQTGTPHVKFKLAPAEGLLLRAVSYEALEWDSACGSLNPQSLQKERQRAAIKASLIDELISSA